MFSFLNHEKNKPELLCSKTTKDKAVGEVLEKSYLKRDMQSIFNASHVIRDDIIQMRTDCKLEGHLDTTDRDKHNPHTLYSLLRWIT